jgi:hypothetical protein
MEIVVHISRGMLMEMTRRWQKSIFIGCSAVLFAIQALEAKRSAPEPVRPVVIGSVEYSAPHEKMGSVVATDTKTHRELWQKQIYAVRIDPALERDVQDVFIKSLAFAHGTLTVTNERGERYALDLATCVVTRLP